MELTMLGTGNAGVTKCYNTCFLLNNGGRLLLVDGGGGNTLLRQLKEENINWQDIRHMVLTHGHIDHLLGFVWMMRFILQNMSRGKYEGEACIYAHGECISLLRQLALLLFPKESVFIDKRLHLVEVKDGEELDINGFKLRFFDIGSSKLKQFGFTLELDDGVLCCCGDEPYRDNAEKYARNAKWLLHEAFCLSTEADEFKPYEKHHSTVADAAQIARTLGVKNLLLYHTEDKNLLRRKELYTLEALKHFDGKVYVPEDLETITL